MFLIYAAKHMPDARRTTERWQALARENGLPGLYLLRVESVHEPRESPIKLGFDAAVEFQPAWRTIAEPRWHKYRRYLAQKLGLKPLRRWMHRVREYGEIVEQALAAPQPDYLRYPCVAPSWDNSSRRSTGALILKNCDPKVYESWLRQTLQRGSPEFVFINAWNEWAEGCHLEPCERYGHAYLKATKAALSAR